MLNKTLLFIAIFIVASCSSVKSKNQADTTNRNVSVEKSTVNKKQASIRKTQIIKFSGVSSTDDSYFNGASSVVNYKGTILVTDTGNNRIKQIKDNAIIAYAGNGQKENIEGQFTNASLKNPENIVIDSKNNIYVSVNYNQILKIDPLGNVTHFAGKYYRGSIDGEAGLDGQKEVASFKFISSLIVDDNDEIYVADKNKIRKISLDGKVTTVAGSNQSGNQLGNAEKALFNQISDIAFNKERELYIVDQVNRKVKKLDSKGMVIPFIQSGIFKWPTSIAVNSKGFLLVFDGADKIVYTFDKQGKLIETLKNSVLTSQEYSFQMKMTIDDNDNLIIPSKDFVNKINKDSQITQIGEKNGNCRNGIINKATFYIPYDGVFDAMGTLYVIEKGNIDIRKISTDGVVSVFCGNGKYGNTIGTAENTSFINTEAIANDSQGNLYVIDGDWKDVRIKKIDSNGVSSIFVVPKSENTEKQRWNDLVFDSKNNLYVSDNGKNVIHKFDSLGNVAEFKVSQTLDAPAGLAVDQDDNLFICDSNNNRIVKVSNNNKVEIITPNNDIYLDEPENITCDKLGNLYVTDKNRTRMIKIDMNLNSEIFLEESLLGKNKDNHLNEYTNTLKIESFGDAIYVFDKYDNQIFKLN